MVMDSEQYVDLSGPVEARYLAFLETISSLRPSLHRYCARMTGSVMDGEDVVQEALFEAYRKLEQFDASRPLGSRFVETRSLKHMAKSTKTRAVRPSSRDPVAPVKCARVFRITARSAGMSRGARPPTCRARARRTRRGSHARRAARPYRSGRL